jgi:hypothetical protein
MATLSKLGSNALAARGGTALATRAAAETHTIKDVPLQPKDMPAEVRLYVLLVHMPFGISDPTVSVVKQRSKTYMQFCQIMPYNDGTGLIIGMGYCASVTLNPDVWHQEAKRLGFEVISWRGVLLPRPIVRKVVEDATLHCYALVGSTRETAFVSYIHARSDAQALKLWSLSSCGLPPQVPSSRCAAIEISRYDIDFLLQLPSVVTYYDLATTS